MIQRFLFYFFALAAPALASEPIRIEVDLREAPRALLHARLRIPAGPGPLTLLYPRWIPGEHGPTGPVTDLSGLELFAGGQRLAWRRDLVNMYAIHLDVPAGAAEVEARLDYLGPTSENGGYTAGPTTTSQLAILNWNLLVLYPAGAPASRISTEPSVILPPGWKFGTSLAIAERGEDRVRFRPVSLEMLIDQPVVAGIHYARFDLTPGGNPPHFIDCVADSEAALALGPDHLAAYRRVPLEYAALFGIRYYQTYHFLLTLSDRTGYAGLEHHQCSDDRSPERSLIDEDGFLQFANLLTHEYFHSWNGKHRRPRDLLSPDYQQPMRTDLLWVYEGLTEYYGDVMTGRTGLVTAEDFHEMLAQVAARMEEQKGREWRPLQDTADSAQLLYQATREWSSRRRGVDFYDEGVLIWLEADTRIRRGTGGRKSLDDFARAFFGDGRTGRINPRRVPGVAPSVAPYEAEEIYAALNRIMPYDWRTFFGQRLDRTAASAPLGGLALAGWRLVFTPSQNRFTVSAERVDKTIDLRQSLGFSMDADGQTIIDVIPGSPADRAGLGPQMKLIGINGRRYSDDALRDAVIATESAGHPVEILAENADYINSYRLSYTGGLRYPHLERTEDAPDLLAEIIKPRS